VNDHQVEGQKTLLTTIDNSNGSYPSLRHQIKVESGKITWKDGKTTEWSGERTSKYDYKNTLTDLNDDWVTITGTHVGKRPQRHRLHGRDHGSPGGKVSCAVSQKSWLPLDGVLEVTPEASTQADRQLRQRHLRPNLSVSANGRSWDITLRQ
jgi:hypothetical protein